MIGAFDGVLGRASNKRSLREARHQKVSIWAFAVGVLLAFGGGFALGGGVHAASGGEDPLNANGGRKPAFVGEVDTAKLASRAFIVSAYPEMADDEAKRRAGDLAGFLVRNGLPYARAHLFARPSGSPLWVVAVYFDGEAQAEQTRELLRSLPADAGDEWFVDFRNKGGEHWPKDYPIR